MYNVTLPNQPYFPVTITFHPLTPTITLSHMEMTFEPTNWNITQILTVYATEDDVNIVSPYMASFNMSLTSRDDNYDGAEVEDFGVTVEDNDDGKERVKLSFSNRRKWLANTLLGRLRAS